MKISIFEGKDLGFTAEEMAMLQALYSRDPSSVTNHISKVKGSGSSSFIEKYVVGYGHKSIADCGTFTMFIEGISHIACKAIQSNQVSSYQESSTRYLDFSTQPMVNPFDLNIFKNRYMVNPSLIEAASHIQSMWLSIYTEFLPHIKTALKQEFPIEKGQTEKVWERAINARAFDIMRGFLPIASGTNTSWTTNLRQTHDHLVQLMFHPQPEVRELAETLWEQLRIKYPSSFESIDSITNDIDNNTYLEEYKYINNYYMDSKALTGINSHTSVELSLNTKLHETRFVTNNINSTYTKFNCSAFDLYGMHRALSRTEGFRLIQDRPKKIELPKWLSRFGTIQMDYVLDYGSFRDIQRHRAGYCPIPLINYNDVCIHPWYMDRATELLDTLVIDHQNQAKQLKFRVEWQYERIQELNGTTTLQNSQMWLVLSQYLMPLGAMALCTGSYSLPALVYLAELRNASTVHPTLRSLAVRISNFLAETVDGLGIYIDNRPDSFVYHRGNQTILEKESV